MHFTKTDDSRSSLGPPDVLNIIFLVTVAF